MKLKTVTYELHDGSDRVVVQFDRDSCCVCVTRYSATTTVTSTFAFPSGSTKLIPTITAAVRFARAAA